MKPLVITDPADNTSDENGKKKEVKIEPERLTPIAKATREALAKSVESRFTERYALKKYVNKQERSSMIDEVSWPPVANVAIVAEGKCVPAAIAALPGGASPRHLHVWRRSRMLRWTCCDVTFSVVLQVMYLYPPQVPVPVPRREGDTEINYARFNHARTFVKLQFADEGEQVLTVHEIVELTEQSILDKMVKVAMYEYSQ